MIISKTRVSLETRFSLILSMGWHVPLIRFCGLEPIEPIQNMKSMDTCQILNKLREKIVSKIIGKYHDPQGEDIYFSPNQVFTIKLRGK